MWDTRGKVLNTDPKVSIIHYMQAETAWALRLTCSKLYLFNINTSPAVKHGQQTTHLLNFIFKLFLLLYVGMMTCQRRTGTILLRSSRGTFSHSGRNRWQRRHNSREKQTAARCDLFIKNVFSYRNFCAHELTSCIVLAYWCVICVCVCLRTG